ncbi:Uncharacterized protein, UPF0548 family [Actinoplanes derwentensis]|uniref:Uncharacterized protein, UPF0548 family n=2 Tax=Actinoplanes derwentensis TaxID=113562 RepID=A0A1H1ZK75_9ACTN|nr:Uncharacterized protein, UPF0548 family [Actinoplanes derwentensis]
MKSINVRKHWKIWSNLRSMLLNAPFTYAEVGATQEASLPPGYKHVRRDIRIGDGPETFDRAATALFGWRMHRGAGFGVVADRPAVPGLPVVIRIGLGRVALNAPCRVVYRVDQPDRRGFAYGTLPGHPESGEEAFVLHLTASGTVRFRITAFSRPATTIARLGGPLTSLAQELATNRYISSMLHLSRP